MLKKSNVDIFRKQGNILGVSITGTPKDDLLIQIENYLSKISQKRAYSGLNRPLFITTPNPEQVVLSQKDPLFKKILKFSNISLCDGTGLLTAHEYFLRKIRNKSYLSYPSYLSNFSYFLFSLFSVLKNGSASDGLKIIKGRDFFLDLVKIADGKRYKVFLLGSTKDILEKTVKNLLRRFPSVHIHYEYNLILDRNGVPVNEKEMIKERSIIEKIQKFNPDMIFVGFGAPKQEKWVYRYISKLNTSLIMVVGGSFDHIAGIRKSVPSNVSRLGFEWLWRLLTGSQRIDRVFNAVVRFPWLIIRSSHSNN